MMQANVGDELTVRGRHQGDEDPHGKIVEIHGQDGSPPYLVRWRDGRESIFFPRPAPWSSITGQEAHRPKAARAVKLITTVAKPDKLRPCDARRIPRQAHELTRDRVRGLGR